MSLEPSEHETPLDLVTLPVTAHRTRSERSAEREPKACEENQRCVRPVITIARTLEGFFHEKKNVKKRRRRASSTLVVGANTDTLPTRPPARE